MSTRQRAALFFLLVASVWTALVNGQPIFFVDTSAYVREPDFAVVHLLGNRFATAWTQGRTLTGAEQSTHAADEAPRPAGQSAVPGPVNSPLDKAILAERSIFYGALLYIGHVTSYLWLCVFVQAAIFLYLVYTLTVGCARLSFPAFFCITLILLAATSVSFFISFLMPDIFASFLILATMVVVGFWDELALRDRICVAGILFYSVLTHTSHLLLLSCLTIVFAGISFVSSRKADISGSVRPRLMLLLAGIIVGYLGEQALWLGARYALGAEPIRPPFMMARLIADGPGYEFLEQNCSTRHYVVCNYMDRVRFHARERSAHARSDAFLWSPYSDDGVFTAVDLPTRKALSSEEQSFVLEVIRFDPAGVIKTVARNSVLQLRMASLDDLFHSEREAFQSFKEKLPDFYFNGLLHSRIALSKQILSSANQWFSFVYVVSMAGLILAWGLGQLAHFPRTSDVFPRQQWLNVLTIAILALAFNAVICGALSAPHPRYQARVSWIPTFVLLLLLAKLWNAYRAVEAPRNLSASEIKTS